MWLPALPPCHFEPPRSGSRAAPPITPQLCLAASFPMRAEVCCLRAIEDYCAKPPVYLELRFSVVRFRGVFTCSATASRVERTSQPPRLRGQSRSRFHSVHLSTTSFRTRHSLSIPLLIWRPSNPAAVDAKAVEVAPPNCHLWSQRRRQVDDSQASLFDEYPDKFGFSISHTTRVHREAARKDGAEYYFVTRRRSLSTW